jgi:CRISPR-associated endonuclease/helicase Cas3
VWSKSAGHGGALSLVQHLEDTSAVAGLLAGEWLSPHVLARLGEELPAGQDDAVLLLRWLAGVHDVGKASSSFACADRAGAAQVTAAGLPVPYARDPISRQPRHDAAGYVALVDWLVAGGADKRAASSQAMAVGGHHGRFPDKAAYGQVSDLLDAHGEAAWRPVRRELLGHIADRLRMHERLQAWHAVRLSPPAQMLLTGAVILSDWIASNEALFPRTEDEDVETRAARGWGALDLPASWRPNESSEPAPAVYRQRTALPAGSAPYPAQVAALEQARAVPPGLAVLEMGMGAGKTEAGLVMAEQWAARSGADGLLFCLPTRATSDSMFTRVQAWLERQDRGERSLSTYLAHGKAGLNTTWQGLTRSAPSGLGDPLDAGAGEEVARAHAWLSGPKKGLLSSIVVGTIDQLLLLALNSKHVALRHLAIAGKVVVLDEVHAADEFMRVYLLQALRWFGAYGTPVVVLTATLPDAQRHALLAAYEEGLGLTGTEDVPVAAYPRLTTTGPRGRSVTALKESRPGISVQLEAGNDDDEQVVRRIAELRPGDGIVLVVRNTVARAQQTYRALRRSLRVDEVLLLHSRLLVADRAAREQQLIAALGRTGHRPARLVVVGTQVVEQSLDIDADLLLTDLAPVDLVLQRLGRLHRHARPRPSGLDQARCVLLGAGWASTPPQPGRGSAAVYGEAALLRAAWVLQPYLTGRALVLPADIDPLVQAAYSDLAVDEPWHEALQQADAVAEQQRQEREARARPFLLRGPHDSPLLLGLNRGSSDVDEDTPTGQAAVRDGVGGVDVLLVEAGPDGLALPAWAGDGPRAVSLEDAPAEAVARAALRCTVPVPEWLRRAALAELAALTPAAWGTSRWLRGLPVVPLSEHGAGRIGSVTVRYHPEEGLVIDGRTA